MVVSTKDSEFKCATGQQDLRTWSEAVYRSSGGESPHIIVIIYFPSFSFLGNKSKAIIAGVSLQYQNFSCVSKTFSSFWWELIFETTFPLRLTMMHTDEFCKWGTTCNAYYPHTGAMPSFPTGQSHGLKCNFLTHEQYPRHWRWKMDSPSISGNTSCDFFRFHWLGSIHPGCWC